MAGPVPSVCATQTAHALATERVMVLGQQNVEKAASIVDAGALKCLRVKHRLVTSSRMLIRRPVSAMLEPSNA